MSQVINPCAGAGALTAGTHMSFGPGDQLLGPATQIVGAVSLTAVGLYLVALVGLSAAVVGRRLIGTTPSGAAETSHA